MNIGIDGYEANTDKRVGIGQYAYQLLVQMHKLDQKNSYTIFLPTSPHKDLPKPRKNWNYCVGKPGGLWTIRQLPNLIRQYPLDLFFSPTHYVPWFTKIPIVMSIMDLSYLHYSNMFRTKDLLQLKYMSWYSIKHAQKICTISEFSKSEIIKYYDCSEENIVVTYPGINIKYQISNIKNANQKFKDVGKYILFVGTIQPRKNVERLVKAFEMIKNEELQLVLAGKKGWLYEPVLKTIEVSPKRNKIKILDFVKDEELPSLYQNAQAFVLPSLYEGFGIPVVEALYFGCPVVVSKTTSLPEVAGKTGIYIDPLDTRDIAQGITKALQLSTSERRDLIKRGKEHSKQFSWEQCAKKTLEVFDSLHKI